MGNLEKRLSNNNNSDPVRHQNTLGLHKTTSLNALYGLPHGKKLRSSRRVKTISKSIILKISTSYTRCCTTLVLGISTR